MPRLAGCRTVVKRLLRDLRSSSSSLEHGSITPTTTDAPTIQGHDEFDRELLQAARLRNQSLPVNQLPNELLVRIFMLIGPRIWKPGDNQNWAWMKLMLVCRYWRDVALATPGIWRSIDIGLNVDWTDLALTRSDPATIDIHMHSGYASEEQLRLICPHAHRIRRLILYNGLDLQWSSALHTLLNRPMPSVETLVVSMSKSNLKPEEAAQPTCLDIQPSPEQFPRLQMLSLSHVAMPRDPLLFSQLCALTLKGCKGDHSLDQFLDILSSCSMLRKLCLLSFLNHLTGDWPSHPVSQRAPVSLPRIAVVVLGNHPPRHSWHFLAYLLLPANTHLTVHVDASVRGRSNDSLLDAIPHSRTTVLPVLCAADKAELIVQGHEYCIRGATPRSGHKASLELRYNPRLHNPWDTGPGRRDLLLRGLADLVSILGQAPSLRCLSIRGLSGTVTQAKWREVLDAFPHLTELRVSDDGPMVALVGALQSESPAGPSSTPEHDLDASRRSLLPCPQLELLALELECDMYAPFLDMLLDCVQRRTVKGLQLHKLELRAFSPADAIEEDWAPFVRELEGLVPEVSYSDQRDATPQAAITNSFLRDL